MDALQVLRPRLQAFLDDLRWLTAVDCGSHDKAGVDEVGRRFERRLQLAGFGVERLPVADWGDCLRARVAGTGRGRLLLLGHLDTVYDAGTAAARPMTVAGGRVLGPGANDMKAGLLAGVYAVEALRDVGFRDFEEIVFFCNGDEEVGSRSSFQLYRPDVKVADAVLVLEAARADGAIVSARKGGGHFYLAVDGRAAHAGVEPERGANAVLELTSRIQAVCAVHGLRPGTTVNVGLVRGGTRANVVPARAEAEFDVRVAAAADMAVVERALRSAAESTSVPGTTARWWGSFGMAPMSKTAAVAELVALARAVAAELGFELRDVATGGMSDANRVAELGVPVLDGLGPVGGMDHGPDEYVELDSIVPRTALLAGLIGRILRGGR